MRFNGTDWAMLGNAGFSEGNSKKCIEMLRYKSWLYTGFVDNTSWLGKVMQFKLCEQPVTPTVTAAKNKICQGESVTLSVVGGALNDATEWSWYAGACTGTLVATGNEITVTPGATESYFVRATGGCVEEQSCVPYALIVAPNPVQPAIESLDNGLTSSSNANNQWFWNGTAISRATAQLYTPSASGDYTVAVTNSDGCTTVSLPFTATVNGNINTTKLVLLPNPVHDRVRVKFQKTVPQVLINIVSLDGKTISSNRFVNVNAATIDTKALQPGIYLVRVFSSDGSSQTLRMIKGN